MLYDPKWEVETKPDVFSLDGLIAWLENQPADQKYDYVCNGECLLALYFIHAGYENISMGIIEFDYGKYWENKKCLPEHFNNISIERPHTFGAALERARAVC